MDGDKTRREQSSIKRCRALASFANMCEANVESLRKSNIRIAGNSQLPVMDLVDKILDNFNIMRYYLRKYYRIINAFKEADKGTGIVIDVLEYDIRTCASRHKMVARTFHRRACKMCEKVLSNIQLNKYDLEEIFKGDEDNDDETDW